MTSSKPVLSDKEQRRRRRERIVILAVMGIIALVTYLEAHLLQYRADLPLSNSVLFFALININTTLLLLLIFLVIRNVVKLFLERRRGILGSRLRTRLVAAFTTLSLIPTILLFFLSLQFISSSVEHWFNLNVERSLRNSLELGKAYYRSFQEETRRQGSLAARTIEETSPPYSREAFSRHLRAALDRSNLSGLGLLLPGDDRWIAVGTAAGIARHAVGSSGEIRRILASGRSQVSVVSRKDGDHVIALIPFRASASRGRALLAAVRRIPPDMLEKMKRVSQGYESYKQAILLKNPIKITHYIILSIVTLMILFFATWYGFYLSRELTEPIRKLAEGTDRVASGDYDVEIQIQSQDEIGGLVRSFNLMARDLKRSRRELEQTNRELMARSQEIEQRQRYMETVLENVATGVISVDAKGRITTVNKAAERMLNIRAESLLRREVGEFMRPPYDEIIQRFLDELTLIKSGTIEQQVKLSMGSTVLTLLVKVNRLKDEEGHYMGMVIVFDDLSQLEKAQRISAWRDVARRIAHEIKNPLTPIQLCAQRLQKRYGERFAGDGAVFQECTSTIVRQVEELKRLVNEFSGFARMPAANLSPHRLEEIIEETLPLYRQAHKRIRFVYRTAAPLPVFDLDREQMKRVLVNLLDNAVNAVDPEKGEVVISTDYDPILRLARIEIADNGPGIPPEDRPRLFEPYFSTKKSGTGLGLAIVNTIIQDHDGFIRVRDNEPTGTRFVIELPVRSRA